MPYTHTKSLFVLLSSSILVSALACTPQEAQNGIIRRGGDVLVSGSEPEIADSVSWDAMLAGGDIKFSGATGGDYIGAGGSQRIGGRIHGSARAAGGEIHVTARIDRDATIAGGQVEFGPTAVVEQNAYLAGGKVQIDGMVRHALQISGGTVVINGTVGGDVDVRAGELHVGPRATIGGNLRYRVPARQVRIDPAAHITGVVTALPVKDWSGTMRLFRLLWLLGFLVAGTVAVILAPRLTTRSAEVLRRRPGITALVGLAWLILLPIAAVLVAVTIIGLPLALLSAGVYVILAYLGRAILAVWLGRIVLGTRVHPGHEGALKSFLAGGLILLLVAFVPVIGPLVMLVATVCGVGALLLGIREYRGVQTE